MQKSRTEVAFIAAALVLLVMPLLVMFGLTALGIVTRPGMMSRMERMMNGEAGGVLLTLFIAWVLLIVAARRLAPSNARARHH